MVATDSIRIRIEPDKKKALSELFKRRGTTVTQAIRGFLEDELSKEASAIDRFDAIMRSADAKIESSGEPEPAIEDVVAYVDRLRIERRADALIVP